MSNNQSVTETNTDKTELEFRGGKLESYIEMVTLPLSVKLLEKNHPRNRSRNNKVVESYARQMESGNWMQAGQAIKISSEGYVIDGQHTLAAIPRAAEIREEKIKKNLTEQGHFFGVELLIISGIIPEAMHVIDDNHRRSVTDAFQIMGKSLPNQQAINGAVKCLMTLHNCTETDRHYSAAMAARRVSTTETIAFYDALPKFNDIAAQFFSKFETAKIRKTMPLGTCLALYYLYYDVDQELVFSIFKALETGLPLDGLRDRSPVYKIYKRIEKRKKFDQRVMPYEYVSLFLWCFCKSLEKSTDQLPSLTSWNWSDNNPVYASAKKKLKALNV